MVFRVSATLEYCAMLVGHRKKVLSKFLRSSCPPARQEIKPIFAKISIIFDKMGIFFDGQ